MKSLRASVALVLFVVVFLFSIAREVTHVLGADDSRAPRRLDLPANLDTRGPPHVLLVH